MFRTDMHLRPKNRELAEEVESTQTKAVRFWKDEKNKHIYEAMVNSRREISEAID